MARENGLEKWLKENKKTMEGRKWLKQKKYFVAVVNAKFMRA